MRTYRQLTSGERYELSALKKQRFSQAAMARALKRHPSTISRELKRNTRRKGGGYRPTSADDMTRGRRRRSRCNWRFTSEQWDLVNECLRQLWSPEQIAGRLGSSVACRSAMRRSIAMYGTIARVGGDLYLYLRGARKQLRKRYGRYDSRGRLAGKRPITERPAGAESRSRIGHLEADTVIGTRDKHCILTLVDRKTGHLMIGKLYGRTTASANRRAVSLIRNAPRKTLTITVDNGTEFHGYKAIENGTGARVYFAAPHHSWERGTSENKNGLIRQYLPKKQSMSHVTQRTCTAIAKQLNARPRKRLGYRTRRSFTSEPRPHFSLASARVSTGGHPQGVARIRTNLERTA